ncbi:hypothetical protein DK926_13865 [Rhodococcus sp. Eu-32]|uniref:hypothetical protein n=1 Tax=Rhodococcus sp. Eu-32 TaxID=1017319 RepID=UPI000DF24FCE|nr:hypothetical protein [Rhodococcus sp. Eu-32]RRQ27203.1 hypothetical protein DK926_13865 [Rhodococcus sp. Eu-32]
MAWTRRNPNGVEDGMVVRKVAAPSSAFRVSGDPDAGRATFVALSRGERTVLNGNARNYRPETADETADREGETTPTVDDVSLPRLSLVDEPEPADADESSDSEVTEMCARLREAVAVTTDGTCSPAQAAAIVVAAAELNRAVQHADAATDRG